jgi:hypothetical protein
MANETQALPMGSDGSPAGMRTGVLLSSFVLAFHRVASAAAVDSHACQAGTDDEKRAWLWHWRVRTRSTLVVGLQVVDLVPAPVAVVPLLPILVGTRAADRRVVDRWAEELVATAAVGITRTGIG